MQPIAITSPDAVVAVLPYVIGFHPDDSLVIAWTRDDLLVLTERIDLPIANGDEALSAEVAHAEEPNAEVLRVEIVEPALQSEPTAATIVVTGGWPPDDDDDDDWPDEDERREAAHAAAHASGRARRRLPHRALVEALQAVVSAAGVEVLDAIHVSGKRWWSYLCEQECCPSEGRRVDPEVELVLRARFALEGIAPLGSRDEVAAQYRPDIAAHRRIAPRLDAAVIERDRLDITARVAWRTAQLAGPCADILHPADIDDDVLAELACALGDAHVRDDFVEQLARVQPLAPVVDALAHAVRATPQGQLAPVATCAGIAAWLHGDGVRATIALELALQDEPSYLLAELVHAAVTRGLPPWRWQESMAERSQTPQVA